MVPWFGIGGAWNTAYDLAMLPPGRARVIRCVFIGLIPCLLAQIWLSRVTEPYPAILLPLIPGRPAG